MKLSVVKKGITNWVLQWQAGRLLGVEALIKEEGRIQIKNLIDLKVDTLKDIPWSNFKGARVFIGLGPEYCESSILKAPEVPDSDVLQALQWELSEVTGIDVEQYEFEGFEIPGPEKGGLNSKYCWIGAVKKTLIHELLELCDQSGIKKIQINAHPLMYRGWFWNNKTELAIGCIFLEEEYGSLCFFKKDEVLFTKQLDWGGESRKKETFWEEVELELQRNLDYFDRRLSTVATQKICVMGAGAEELCNVLSSRFSIPFEVRNSYDFIESTANSGISLEALKGQYSLLGHVQYLLSLSEEDVKK